MLSKRKQSSRQNGSVSRQRRYSSSSQKQYSNPFFETRKKRSQDKRISVVSFKIKLIIFTVLALFVFTFWFIYYSSYFSINSIEARGEERIDANNIESIAWSQIHDSDFVLWQQKNIFIFNEDELVKTLNLKYSFNDIIINKKLPNKLIITYDEKEHSFVWLEKDIYYYTDINGYIIERIGGETENKDYPLIKNSSTYYINSNKITVDQRLIEYIFILIDKLKSYSELSVDYFLLEDNNSVIKVQLQNGPKLFFNIDGDIDKQITKVITLKNDILKEDFFKKEYIDVRIGDRVYHR